MPFSFSKISTRFSSTKFKNSSLFFSSEVISLFNISDNHFFISRQTLISSKAAACESSPWYLHAPFIILWISFIYCSICSSNFTFLSSLCPPRSFPIISNFFSISSVFGTFFSFENNSLWKISSFISSSFSTVSIFAFPSLISSVSATLYSLESSTLSWYFPKIPLSVFLFTVPYIILE